MQIHIRPFKTVDAAELQSAVLESVGHISPWLEWATPRYLLSDARDWVSESRSLWAKQKTYPWIITDENSHNIWGSVEINRPVPGEDVGRMGYWIRRQVLGRGICTRASRAALEYVFKRDLFEQVDLFIDPSNAASIGVARKLGAQLQGKKADEISYQGVVNPALHFSVTPENLVVQKESKSRRRALNSDQVSEGSTTTAQTDGSVYKFKRSLKNARL